MLIPSSSMGCSIFSPKVESSKADWELIVFKFWCLSLAVIDLRNQPGCPKGVTPKYNLKPLVPMLFDIKHDIDVEKMLF
ncbi:unnamed protein product [Camellia sinensis]